MPRAEKNPLAIFGIAPELFSIYPDEFILELVEGRYRSLSLLCHPDSNQNDSDAPVDLQEIQAAIRELRNRPVFDQRKAQYLRPYKREEQEHFDREEEVRLERVALRDAEHELSFLLRKSYFPHTIPQANVDQGRVISIFTLNPPPCRILLNKAHVFAKRKIPAKLRAELVLEADGRLTIYRVAKVEFYERDGLPIGVPRGWINLHGSGPDYRSYYWQRQEDTAQAFPYRLLAGTAKFDFPKGVHIAPALVGDEALGPPSLTIFHEGFSWEDISQEAENFIPHCWGYLVFSRLVESAPYFWVIGPVTSIALI